MHKNDLMSLVAAVVGGALGYFVFLWLTQQGFYALIIPGGLLGIAAGAMAPRSTYVPIVCGCMALVLGLITEWRFRPFIKDESLIYFLTHVYQLKPLTLIMIAIGTAMGFWIPRPPSRTQHASVEV